jgi:hypothetical protein
MYVDVPVKTYVHHPGRDPIRDGQAQGCSEVGRPLKTSLNAVETNKESKVVA